MSGLIDRLISKYCQEGVEYRKLDQCCNILDNQRRPIAKTARIAGKYPYYGANGIQDYVDKYIFDGEFILVGEDGSVLTSKGNPVVTWASGKIWVNNHAHIVSENEYVKLKFLFYYLQTISISHLIRGNIPKLTGSDFKCLTIPVPPLPVQKEIVRILDKFSNLTNNISEGLPAEIKLDYQRYEYYRDKLLEFERKKAIAL